METYKLLFNSLNDSFLSGMITLAHGDQEILACSMITDITAYVSVDKSNC